MRQIVSAIVWAVAASLALATTALAMNCTNASKGYAAARARLLLGTSGEILWMTPGIGQRVTECVSG